MHSYPREQRLNRPPFDETGFLTLRIGGATGDAQTQGFFQIHAPRHACRDAGQQAVARAHRVAHVCQLDRGVPDATRIGSHRAQRTHRHYRHRDAARMQFANRIRGCREIANRTSKQFGDLVAIGFDQKRLRLHGVLQQFAASVDSIRAVESASSSNLVDFLITNSNFARWRELTVTYDVPNRFAQKAGADRASLSLSAHNLALLTNYQGFEPEAMFLGGTRGGNVAWEQTTLPQLRTWIVTLNLTF